MGQETKDTTTNIDKPSMSTNKLGIISFIIGLLSLITFILNMFVLPKSIDMFGSSVLVFSCCVGPIGILLPLAGVILGIISVVKRNKYQKQNLWISICGIVLGAIGLLLSLLPEISFIMLSGMMMATSGG
jgi:uncharacterized membrane protein HdeD (DUF308 family)